MKEDYLWNKTGNDPEIEKLENALKAFRQKDETPPALPAKVIPVKSESPRRIFPFAFAFAASLTFVLILVGVWFQSTGEYLQPGNDIAKNTQQTTVEKNFDKPIEKPLETTFEKGDVLPVKTNEIPKVFIKRKISKVEKVQAKKIRYSKKENQKPKIKQINSPQTETVKLTKEEKFAYDQLMLALSITSEKLNLVKDKVRGEVKEEISIKKKIENRSN